MRYYTYILFSKTTGRYYTGSCENLSKRFTRHNQGMVQSTRIGLPWQLVWSQQSSTRSEA
ncbi:MAG: GIY-YIG nuclease family protein, partial [Balneolaceae bacterium]|nr:GIY-YIG nuclease family protein [Balneolaceae bacterium]